MADSCPECGALLPATGDCYDHFLALLAREWQTGGYAVRERGRILHFYAVSSYLLQHPQRMQCTGQALAAVRHNLADHLAGRTTLSRILAQTGQDAAGRRRVRRRPGEAVPPSLAGAWPLRVTDVLAGGTEGFGECVTAWAVAVIVAADAAARHQ
ncbi:MAG TPA: DUF5946 family protein [bacterium]|nr:DUF5946 family protein [bacterium]